MRLVACNSSVHRTAAHGRLAIYLVKDPSFIKCARTAVHWCLAIYLVKDPPFISSVHAQMCAPWVRTIIPTQSVEFISLCLNWGMCVNTSTALTVLTHSIRW